LASTPLTSYITPPLMLIPLFAMAVGLPFLRGRALRSLLVGACLTELLVTISAAKFLPTGGPEGEVLGQFLFVGSTTAIAMLIAFLLNQFSRRIRGALTVARAAVATREEFLSIASHELQTPMTVLKLNVQRLAVATRTDPAATDAKLRAIEGQVNRLSRLVGNMLDLSRLNAGKLALELAPTRLDTVVERVLEELRPMAERTGSSIDLKVASLAEGLWDVMRVEQVVSNLVSNAIKYGEGKPIQVTVDQPGPFAEVMVRDGGAGISPRDRERLFAQFQRGSNTHAQGGVGLGLYIARQLSELMGGTVVFNSGENEGTTFTLKLPATPKPSAPAPVRQVRSGSGPSQ
jgi:signal transduction histidine kinase